MIIDRTNEKMNNTFQNNGSHKIKYKKITLEELKKYIGMIIIIRIIRIPNIWGSSLVRSTISLDRFEKINKFLTLEEKSSQDPQAEWESFLTQFEKNHLACIVFEANSQLMNQ